MAVSTFNKHIPIIFGFQRFLSVACSFPVFPVFMVFMVFVVLLVVLLAVSADQTSLRSSHIFLAKF